MTKLAGPIVGMMALSAALSILTVVLTKAFPRPLMYFLMGFTLLVEAGLAIVGFVSGSLALGVCFIIMLLINLLMIYCMWDYFQLGIRMIECAARFITEKPAVYFIALMCLFLNTAYVVFWIFSWIGVYSTGFVNNSDTFRILTIVWYIDAIFWGFFLYYCMTFLVASACAYWYYQSKDNSVLRGVNNIKYHLGSICFGAIVITLITILRMLASTARRAEGAARIAACIAECILRCIEDIVKALNCNAMIVMAMTGEGYIDSAKSAVSLIFDNLGLFIVIDYFANFYNLFTTVFVGLVPAFIGGGIIYYMELAAGNPLASSYAIWGGIIIFLLSTLISSVVIGVLILSLNCIYIFFCFDKKFISMGMEPRNIPVEIKNIFHEAGNN